MRSFKKSNTKFKEKEKSFLESLRYYSSILLGSIFFTFLINDSIDSSWDKVLGVVFVVGVILSKLDDLEEKNRLLKMTSKENECDIEQLEDRIQNLEEFIRDEIRDVRF